MKKLVYGTVALVVALSQSPLMAEALNQDTAKAVILQTMEGNHHMGWKIKLENKTDGTFSLTNYTQNRTLNGKWRMDGNKYCNKSNKMRRGREGCFEVFETNNGYDFINTKGKVAFSLK